MFDKRYIHDVFYNQNRLYLIVAAEESLWNVYWIPSDIGSIENPDIHTLEEIHHTKRQFYVRGCPDHRCYLYYIETAYTESVWLLIDNTRNHFYVKQYPTFDNEFIASTLVKHENNYLPQWIEYHRRLGIQRFVIYDNAGSDNDTYGWTKTEIETLHTLSHTHTRINTEQGPIEETLKPYIEDGIVYIIKWPYPYYLRVSRNSAQATQQNHSLYAFRQAKYIAFFDVDEYMNPQSPYTSLTTLLQDIVRTNHIDETNIGSYLLQNRWFYNPFQKPVQDYEFFCIDDTNNITKEGHEKSIVIPENVDIHGIHKTSIAKAIVRISNTLLYFNHYGFLNKCSRADTFKGIYDNSIVRHLRFVSSNRPYLGAFLNGGLGNQMFQIATAYSTAKTQRKRLCVNNTLKSSHSSVCYFNNIFRKIEVNNALPYKDGDLYKEPPEDFTQRLNIPYFDNEDKLLWGFFQNEKYFNHNRTEILELFVAEPERMDYLTMKYPAHTNGIFIHYRRTDYLQDKRYNMVGNEYYQYCIRQMREKYPQATFYIFSDDIAYCQQQTYLMELPYKQFITDENDVDSLYLMSLCKLGGIGTNSSFSWWGGWLNTNESKVVMYPQQWFDHRTDLDIWWSGCYKMRERPQVHFLTYGGGPMYYLHAVDRLVRQATELQLFDHIYGFKENDLKHEHPFWEQHRTFILQNPSGFGYWIWKAYLIRKIMNQSQENDIIVYCDCGNELDIRKKDAIRELLEKAAQEEIIGQVFKGHHDIPHQSEIYWTKLDVILALKANECDAVLHSPQHQANPLIIRKTANTQKLVDEWCDLGLKNYHYLNDFPSYNGYLPEFVVHKHSQSLFSILSKQYGLFSKTVSTEGVIDVFRNHSADSRYKS